MKLQSCLTFAVLVMALVAALIRAPVVYQIDGFTTGGCNGSNNSQGPETEDGLEPSGY